MERVVKMREGPRSVSMAWLLVERMLGLLAGRRTLYAEDAAARYGPELARGHRSVFVRHLDCGSCNGCEIELSALVNPLYDIERFGIRFEASPRHADVLAMTGPFTRNLETAARLTYAAMTEPRCIVTIGDCAHDGGIFKDAYALADRPALLGQAIAAHVPGCPPTPEAILRTLARLSPHL